MVEQNNIKLIKNCDFIPNLSQGFHNSHGISNNFVKSVKGVWEFSGGQDSYINYKKNLKTQPENWYYRNNKINYTINSWGYRAKEFDQIDWKNSIVIFGCSHVFGVGVDDKHTISSFLEEMVGIPVINMGVSGSSIGCALHNSLMLYKKYEKPKMVIYSWTSLMRSLFYTDNGTTFKIFNGDDIDDQYSHHYIPFNLLNVQLIRNLWENKCPMYEYSFFDQTGKILECDILHDSHVDYARDLEHNGIDSNKKDATNIYKKIKKYID